jgi:SGNH hydrolase-like domain, acetyltransferase AlgX
MKRTKYFLFSLASLITVVFAAGDDFVSSETLSKCPAARKGTNWIVGSSSSRMFLSIHFPKSYTLPNEIQEGVQKVSKLLEKRGSHLIVIPIPSAALFYSEIIDKSDPLVSNFDFENVFQSYKNAIKLNLEQGINTIDFTDAIRSLKGKDEEFFFKRDIHWTPTGAQIAAREIADLIEKKYGKEYLAEKKTSYNIKQRQNSGNSGYARFITELCGIPVPWEKNLTTTAEPKESVGLFDEIDQQILLLGDSFGNTGIDAFLANQTSLNVENESISGGGYGAASIKYFSQHSNSEKFPKFIIWFYYYNLYDLPKQAFFDELIPSLSECKKPLNLQGLRETDSTNEFKIPKLENAIDYFLKLSDIDTAEDLSMSYKWTNGDQVLKKFNRKPPVAPKSKYFVNLPRKNNLYPDLLLFPANKTLGDAMKIELCQY